MMQQLNCITASSAIPSYLSISPSQYKICSPAQLLKTRTLCTLLSGFGSFQVDAVNFNKKGACVRCRRPQVRAAVPLPNLKAYDFQHPLDKQNTTILRAIPGLNEVGKLLLGPVAEQVMLLENIATSILVSEKQLPSLHKLMVEAANILNLEVPDLYVRQNPVPNAYTLAIAGRKPFIVIHTSIVELLKPAELQAVIAHELGHLKCDHGIWLTFANILTLSAYSLPGLGGFIAQNAEDQLLRWLRAAELTCDRAALLVAQDPHVIISLLMKLTGGCPSMAEQLNLDEFLRQARSYDEAAASPLGWYLKNARTRQLTHPLPVLRAREIDNWARSAQYKALIANAEIYSAGVQRMINGKHSVSTR